MLCFTDICCTKDTAANAVAYRAGPEIVKGLLAALLAVSALARVHKVCTIFLELTRLQHSGRHNLADQILHWLQLSMQEIPQGESW